MTRRLDRAIDRGPRVQIFVDGVPVEANTGESVAAALIGSGRPTPTYCGIGLCFACVLPIDGQRVRACQTPVRDGQRIGGAA